MSSWYFSYDSEASPERFQHRYEVAVAAELMDHRLAFTRPQGDAVTTATPVEEAGSTVLGTAYLVTDETFAKIAGERRHGPCVTRTVRCADGNKNISLFVDTRGAEAAAPEELLGSLREGLCYFHPVSRIDAYLAQAAGREKIFSRPLIQRGDEASFKLEYNCNFRRLYPWKGVTRPPWGGAVGIVAPGDATTPHNHDEEETALVIAGRGELTLEGEKTPIERGDAIFFPPTQTHTIANTGEEDLEILFIWWGGRSEEQREAAKLRV